MRMEADRANTMLRDLRRSGLKLTPQRIAMVRLFADDASHPTAQDLFDRLRPVFPSMSFATVYNTLDALARAGLAGTVRLSGKRGDAARFDPNITPHHHAVCDQCGAVLDIAAGTLAPTTAASKRLRRAAPGFSVRAVERIYRGLCATCTRPVLKTKGESHGQGTSRNQDASEP
jgi:Fur family peroxide stress response transcriptional regulator